MKLTIERGHLLKALQHVTSVVEKRTTIPILSHALLSADALSLKLKATDLDIEIVETAPAETLQPGAATVSAHMLHDIVRRLPDGAEVTISTAADGARLQIVAGRSRFQLAALPAGDFPDLGASPMTHSFKLPAKDLIKLIEKTRFAISTEETRYYLNGIFLHVATNGDSVLRAVATDGHRLAQMEVPLPEGIDDYFGIIVPRKTIGELLKLAGDAGDELGVELSTNKIRVTVPGKSGAPAIVFTSKLIDGSFPDYGRVVPEGNNKTLTVVNSDFVRAVDRVSTLVAEKGRAVKFSISPDNLTLSVNNPDSGSAVEELAAVYSSAPVEIGFNARYVLDIAAEIDGKEIVFELSDSSSPTIVKDSGDSAALYVLMPMRC